MQSTGPRLELLVLRAQANDEVAFAALVERVDAALRRHAQRFLTDPDLSRDATQDAWLAIVRGLRRLEDPARFLPWALRIVAARAVDVVRRRRRSPATSIDGHELTAAEAVPVTDDDRLRAAVQRLDLDHRVVIELHYLEGLTVPEIASAIAVPVGTVKSRLYHARSKLRTVLVGEHPEARASAHD